MWEIPIDWSNPPNDFQFDIKRCTKCKEIKPPIIRHHKGHDGYLGRFDKAIKKNYNRYLHCVDLCVQCHAIIHVIYFEVVHYELSSKAKIKKTRESCIATCDEWLQGKDFGITQYDYRVIDLLRKWKKSSKKPNHFYKR